MIFTYVLIYAFLGSVGAVSVAALLLLIPQQRIERLVPYLISYAIGTLLSVGILRMLPRALTDLPGRRVAVILLAAFVMFYVLESLLVYRHCHEKDCTVHSGSGPLILIGDAFHNFIDGVVVASAFLTSSHVGFTAGLAVIVHEIPQEIGDFGILLQGGYSRGKAYGYNLLSSSTAIIGAIGGFCALSAFRHIVPYVLCVSAAGFMYIALADLIPGRRQRKRLHELIIELLLIGAGATTIVAMTKGH
jgi:zinc and cadmium transporter